MYVNTCHGLQKYGNVQWGQGNIKIALSALAGYQNFNTLHIPNLCMSLDDHKKLLNRELEQFQLHSRGNSSALPRPHEEKRSLLMKKKKNWETSSTFSLR